MKKNKRENPVTPSCQTFWDPKNVEGKEEISITDTTHYADNALIAPMTQKSWEKAMDEVLEEHSGAWKRLAEL